MKVLPIYLFLMKPSSNGIPEALAKPNAASSPESGTPTTTSASTGYALARKAPALTLESCTETPSRIESGLAKYIYSNTHIEVSAVWQ